MPFTMKLRPLAARLGARPRVNGTAAEQNQNTSVENGKNSDDGRGKTIFPHSQRQAHNPWRKWWAFAWLVAVIVAFVAGFWSGCGLQRQKDAKLPPLIRVANRRAEVEDLSKSTYYVDRVQRANFSTSVDRKR